MYKYENKNYRISNANAIAITVAVSPVGLSLPIILIGLNSYWQLWIGLVAGVLLEVAVWYGWSHGTYITIDENNNIYNTFFFIRRNLIPLSSITSLMVGHPLTFLGTTSVWKVYYDKNGKQIKNSLATKEMLKKDDFKNLINEIHKINPAIQIPEELFK